MWLLKKNILQNCIVIFLALTTLQSAAQFSIAGKITDTANNPVPGCNILLLNPQDSAIIKGMICTKEGGFILKDIAAGSYLLNCSYNGYQNSYLPVALTAGSNTVYDLKTIVLHADVKQLNEVTVVAKKPLFEQKIDRMVINVKSSITSIGSTVLDVLQKSPGLMINRQEGTINMSGKNGVQVMINGKISYMPASALMTMLEGMPANNVERIELITAPPAKYDAGGNGGYINIVLVQNPNQGFNGSYTITAAGFYGSAPAATFDFNYRNKKINLYGSSGFSRRAQLQFINSYRRVAYQNKITETDLTTTRDPSQLNFNTRFGMDYQLSKKTTLGMLVAGYNNKWKMNANNTSFTTINTIADTNIIIHNTETNHWKHGMANINLQHTEATGSIAFNIGYLYYSNRNPTNYNNWYYNGSNQFLSSADLTSTKTTIINILPVQLDYTKKINAKVNMEAGIKGVLSKFTNDVLVAELKQNIWQADPAFTGNYLLKENIGAVYASASIAANDKNTIKAGLRYEYTSSNLGSQTKKNIVDRKYGYLFPTIYWNHAINDNNSINISYNRRINRPTFNNLAPFLIFFDPKTFISGNAALQPAISDGIKADYTLKEFIFSLGYTYEKASIGNFQIEIDNATNKQYMIAQNLSYTKSIVASMAIPTTVTKWWKSTINITGLWNHAEANYSKTPISVTVYNFNISGAQSFTLPKKMSAEISGFYQSESLFGVSKMKALGQLNIAFQKKFTNSSLKLGIDDVFSSFRWVFITDVPSQQFYSNNNIWMTRRMFKVTFTHNFGNKILKDKRARATASDQERQRVTQ